MLTVGPCQVRRDRNANTRITVRDIATGLQAGIQREENDA